MRQNFTISLGEELYANGNAPISSSALGAEFLGWEFFSNFETRHEQVNFDHVRWPGGIPVEEGINVDNSPDQSREVVFDLTFDNFVDWDRGVSNGYSNDPVPREGIRELLEFAVKNNASFAMVAPTMRYIEMAFEDQELGVEKAREDIRLFATRLLAGQFGELPKEFILEIGSEYYSLPIWRDNFQNPDLDIARTAGDVFAAMVAELDDVLNNPDLNPTGYDINIAVQLGRSLSREDDPSLGFDANGVINGGWGEHADNDDFIAALQDVGALDAIDSLIWHRYVPNFWGIERGLWEPVNGGFTLSAVIDQWEAATGRDLGLVGGHLAPAAQGDDDIEFHAPGLTSILQLTVGLLAEGMDHGTIFGLGFNTDGSLGFKSKLLLGGQLYGMMVESLPGMHLHDGFQANTSPVEIIWENGRVVDEFLRVDNSVNSYVFENDDLVVMFLIAKDFDAETLDYTLHFAEAFEKVEITRLWDAGEQVFHLTTGDLVGHAGEMSHELSLPLKTTEFGSSLDVTFNHDYEVLRITLDRIVVDTFSGTDGDDLFRINHKDDVILDAGKGRDTVQSSVNFSLRDAPNGRHLEDLRFTGSNNLFGLGNSGDNTIIGNTGNNHLSGVWGDDTLNGEAGDDTLIGEHGDDYLFGDAGKDELWGGDGDDVLEGGDNNDFLSGGNGNDVVHGGEGHDTLHGGDGADRFVIDPASRSGDIIQDFTFGEDVIDLSNAPVRSFDDLLIFWVNNQVFIQDNYGTFFFLDGLEEASADLFLATDFVFAGSSWPFVSVNTEAVARTGLEQPSDTVLAQPSDQTDGGFIFEGTDSDDLFWIERQSDTIINAGDGDDSVRSSVNFTLRRHSNGNDIENLELVGDENLIGVGNSADNILIGNSGDNHLSGVWGDDTLFGEDGNDTLLGVNGANLLHGGAGNDYLSGGEGNDTLFGGDGNDTIVGGDSAADLRDVVFAGAGDDSIQGGYGNDELRGDAGNDSIEGGFGVDLVIGGTGNDVLTGSAFSDEIFGGDGFDFINGGFGSDRVNGGADGDKFFHVGIADHGSDWIQDYNAAEGDVLFYGGGVGPATASDFLVQRANTPNAGSAAVDEAFIAHIPSGNLLWALVDGDAQSAINIQIDGQVFDLLA